MKPKISEMFPGENNLLNKNSQFQNDLNFHVEKFEKNPEDLRIYALNTSGNFMSKIKWIRMMMTQLKMRRACRTQTRCFIVAIEDMRSQGGPGCAQGWMEPRKLDRETVDAGFRGATTINHDHCATTNITTKKAGHNNCSNDVYLYARKE